MIISVLVCREGNWWVAQALEVDVASQAIGMLDAVRDVGRMLDVRDRLVDESAVTGETVAKLPRTPEPYFAAYVAGSEIGIMPLGTMRLARIRMGDSPMRRPSG